MVLQPKQSQHPPIFRGIQRVDFIPLSQFTGFMPFIQKTGLFCVKTQIV